MQHSTANPQIYCLNLHLQFFRISKYNMKRLIPILLLCAGLWACKGNTADSGNGHGELVTTPEATVGDAAESQEESLPDPDATGSFGAVITGDGAIASSELESKLKGKDSLRVKVRGVVNSCCQNKGCWMKMPLTADKEMTVKFKDYGFFVPKNSASKTAVIEGWAYRELVSVDELRHFAEDGGATEEEVQKITQPEERVTFMADGVLIAPSAEGAH